MASKPDALYLCLLEDLSSFLSGDQFRSLALTGKCGHLVGESPKQYAAVALANSFLKKFEVSGNRANEAAAEEFLTANSRCREFDIQVSCLEDEYLLGEFRRAFSDFCSLVQDECSLAYLFELGNLGPGVNVGTNGASDLYTKLFSSRLTATCGSLLAWYKRLVQPIPEWHEGESQRDKEYGSELVEGSKVSFAPKQTEISRMICSEPTVNMFFQLGFGRLIEKWLRKVFGVSLETQPDINRELARIGSITGGISTLDLKSASNYLSMTLLRKSSPREFLYWVEKLRSPRTKLSGEWVDLHMASTMGNGFTFPLQTAIFCCVVKSVYRLKGIPLKRDIGELRNWGVFGDDIIVETQCVRQVVRLLNLLGFVVNGDKSFSEGYFRESCGADYYQGHPVRGVYLRKLATPQDIYSVINRLARWSAGQQIPLHRAISWLCARVSRILVPRDEQDDCGIKVPSSLVHWKPKMGRVAYKRFVPNPKALRVLEDRIWSPRRERVRSFNPGGLYTAFIHGSLRALTITLRQESCRYTLRHGVTPNWDRLPVSSNELLSARGWQDWERLAFAYYFKM